MFMQASGEQTYALLRIISGFLFSFHGAQKLFGFPLPFIAAKGVGRWGVDVAEA